MPLPSADKPSDSPADARPVVMLWSPREAAARAIVYRRRRAGRPRERGLRMAGLAGTLLVHVLALFGVILGPAYELPEPRRGTAPLQVRLIDKPEPPPPPVRGTPPKRIGPRHRGNAPDVSPRRRASVPAARPGPALPAPEVPVITVGEPEATVRIGPVAAPPRPVTLPQPQPPPAPDLAPVPWAGVPPQVELDTPPAVRPVPPAFQPEPVRKPQVEGNRPMPPPPSLAIPAVPAQAGPAIAAPSLALDRIAPPREAPPAMLDRVRPPPAVPAAPDIDAIPLPAQAAPVIELSPQPDTRTRMVPRERPQVQAPGVRLAPSQPAAAPRDDATIAPAAPTPPAPAVDAPSIEVAPAAVELVRPQVPELAPAATAEAAPDDARDTPPSEPAAPQPDRSAAAAADRADAPPDTPSTAPVASPRGSDAGAPGAREGAPAAADASGVADTSAPAPASAIGSGDGQGEGRQGQAQAGAAEGPARGQPGGYIQLKPTGDTRIMEHRAPDIGYRPTRFEDDWTPENESAIDTALRRAVEKTTVKHTFHLPRGVRVHCKVSPLFPIALFGCGGDPPAKAARDPRLYERLNLAPARPLDPEASASAGRASSAPVPAAPIHLDNAAQCAAARISGGPPPPGCPTADDEPALPLPSQAPAPATSAWVPASDQFR